MKIRIACLLMLILCLPVPATAGLDKNTAKALKEDFNTEFRQVRPEFLAYPSYSLKVDDQHFTCTVPAIFRRLSAAGETFRIRGIHAKRDHFRVELETSGKRRVSLRGYDRGNLRQEFLDQGLQRLLNDVFDFGPELPPVTYLGHTESKLLHLDRCNHPPGPETSQVFTERAAAEAEGYRPCPICFSGTESLPYQGYLQYRLAGLESARSFQLLCPPVGDPQLQGRLQELATEVLDSWPLELTGFDYQFQVVRSDYPLAVSFATGIVLVSDTFLQAADTDEEILFVLAHEIAHCELHLPPRSLLEGESGVGPLSSRYTALASYISSQQLAADLVALAWFTAQEPGTRDLMKARGALAKVQEASGLTNAEVLKGQPLRSLGQRLMLFESGRFRPADPSQVFLAYDGEDDIRHEVRFLGLLWDTDENRTVPYFLVTTTDLQEDTFVAGGRNYFGSMKDCQGNFDEFKLEPFLCKPGYSTLVAGESRYGNYFEKFVPGDLQSLKLGSLKGVKDWRRSR
jgi:hypothetical protein